jgi:DNA-binding helix-hairpin-helix protein with protein kinase domain
MPFLTDQARMISLGPKMARGSGGDVYEIVGDQTRVAKIYHKPQMDRTSRKLAELVRRSPPELANLAAWPITNLRTAPDEPVRGIVMRKIAARPLHELDTPAARRESFPLADWRFLIHAAKNCATVVDASHRAGVVLGDVHDGRFLVDEEGNVQLIDCDSCQIATEEETFCCNQAVMEFLAPELQTANLESFTQTPNHDAFGLAVVIYRLLMMGRHPFVGFQGNGRMPIARAIQEYRFAQGSSAETLQMAPPPHSLLLGDLPEGVANLFHQAFSRGAERPGGRPSARVWLNALDDFERQLKPCNADPGHLLVPGTHCPWCRIEHAGGPAYFSTKTTLQRQSLPDPEPAPTFSALLEQIESPQEMFDEVLSSELPIAAGEPLPAGVKEHQQTVHTLTFFAVASTAPVVIGLWFPLLFYVGALLVLGFTIAAVRAYSRAPLPRIRQHRRNELARRQAEWDEAYKPLHDSASRVSAEFAARFKSASATRDKLQSLHDQAARELRLLQANAHQRQLEAFLGTFWLRTAKLDRLNRDKLLLLQSYGIETARHVSERVLSGIHAIGETLPNGLITWRKALEAKFQYNDALGPPADEVAQIRNKYIEQRLALQEELEVDLEALRTMSSHAREQATESAAILAPFKATLAQAKADMRECR